MVEKLSLNTKKMMTQTKKTTKKQEDERKVIFVKSDKKLDSKTLIDLINIVLNSKSKGLLIFELFILLLIIAWIIALIKYFFF